MKLKQYISHRTQETKRKYRTVNVDQDLHHFFKRTSNYYNIPLSELIHNILSHWKDEFQDEIKSDMIRNLNK